MTVTNLPAVRTNTAVTVRPKRQPLPAPRTVAHLAPVVVRHRATATQANSTTTPAQVSNPRNWAYWLAVVLMVAVGVSLAGLLFNLSSAY